MRDCKNEIDLAEQNLINFINEGQIGWSTNELSKCFFIYFFFYNKIFILFFLANFNNKTPPNICLSPPDKNNFDFITAPPQYCSPPSKNNLQTINNNLNQPNQNVNYIPQNQSFIQPSNNIQTVNQFNQEKPSYNLPSYNELV